MSEIFTDSRKNGSSPGAVSGPPFLERNIVLQVISVEWRAKSKRLIIYDQPGTGFALMISVSS
jgi:hypothetical protein